MHTDNYFWQGSTHLTNEDYTIAGDKYIIVSDGCSGSPNTDWGSRFISKAAEKSLSYFPSEAFQYAVITKATGMRLAAEMPEDCLDATLLVAAKHKGKVIVKLFGDGVVAFMRPGGMEVHSLEYAKEAPFYLNYLNNQDRLDGFTKYFGFDQRLTTYKAIGSGIVTDRFEKEFSSKEYYTVEAPAGTTAVILMSDGVRSFIKRNVTESSITQESVELSDVLEKLLDFKNYFGVFVQRRSKRFVKVEMPELGWINMDDVSIAGMWL